MSSRIRPNAAVEGATFYSVPRPSAPIDLRLDGNEGVAPPFELLERLCDFGPEVMRCYPDSKPLEAALAERWELAPDQVLVTAGADEALDRIARSVLGPGRELILPVPTFEMIERYAHLAGAEVVTLPWGDADFPVEAILAARTDRTAAVAVVTPNNPTGRSVSREQLCRLAEAMPEVLLIVDAAYGEFARDDVTDLALQLDNAVVTRTFSKAWGLAGLRVGYAMGPTEILSWLRRAGGPYSVAGPALMLAERRLATGEGDLREFVSTVRDEAYRLSVRLRGWGVEAPCTEANFLLAKLPDAAWVHAALGGMGIAVRAFPGRPGLEDRLRITLPGDERKLARLERGLATVLEPEALLFDVDGVLADVSNSYRMATKLVGSVYDVEIEDEEISAAKQAGNANDDWELTWRLLGARGVEVELEDVIQWFESFYQGDENRVGLHATETLIPSRDWLEQLASRVPLAVVTGRPRHDLDQFLDQQGVRDLFRVQVCRDDTTELKPHPAPVRKALSELGVERAWLIGDTPDDMRSARAAGVLPLGFVAPGESTGSEEALVRAGAARVLARVEDVEALWR